MQPNYKKYKEAALAGILILQGLLAYGQTAGNVNNIRIRTTRTPLTTTAAVDQQMGNKSAVNVTYEYMDGLGRPLQTVQQYGSPAGNDIIQPYVYDQFSRDSVKYLPYTINSSTPGAYQPTAITVTSGYGNSQQYQFYQQAGAGYVNTTYPYAGTNYEPSGLNRTTEQGAPGTAWQLSTGGVSGGGHTVNMDYASNDQSAFVTSTLTNNPGSRMVALYTATINSTQSRTLVRTGNTATYNTGELVLTISKDENWNPASDGCLNTTEEYKDLEGHVVLKRTYNQKGTGLEMLSTYYVYDDYGLLAFVLPPGASPDATTGITQAMLDNLCYQYRYDERGRLSQKKLPGKGWDFVVYNTIDQPVATQDSLQRMAKQWIFTKYDGTGRPVMTGIWTSATVLSQATLQTTLNSQATLWETPVNTGAGYTAAAWPNGSTTPLAINYYDNYTNIPSLPANFSAPAGASIQARGLLTATKTAVLSAPASMLWTAHYYDDLGRTIESYNQHYLHAVLNNNNCDAVTTTYNFNNAPTTVTRQHFNTANTITPLVTIANTYIYDHMGRKLKTWEQLTNVTTPTPKTLISQTDYNELGQLLTKHLHSTDSLSFLQNIAYTYNERGWLLQSSAPLFELQLQYNTSTIAGIAPAPQYNGNIASQSWGTSAAPNTKSYTYGYDKLNRLRSGVATDNNTENAIVYDQMGNITALSRYLAGTKVDQLGYTYTTGTNQLQTVANTGTSDINTGLGATGYLYDGNGNMLSATNATDNIHNKSFTYNLLNLPLVATIPAGTATYTYDANGNKLRKVDVLNGVTTATDYINGIQYGPNTGFTTLSFIQTEEGKAERYGTGYDYTYYLGDNLGNTRITFDTRTGAAVTEQTDDYYPFGLEILRTSPVPNPKNEYLYNKKELQEEFGEYDYGARFYDPVIARWTTVDPLAEKFRRWSPYNYVDDDPIRLTDPDGMGPEWIKGANAKVNGGKATYTVNKDGTLKWTNATKATKELGNNLAAHGGLADLKRAVDAKQEIDLNHSSGKGPGDRLGQTALYPDKLGSTTAAKAEVNVYQGAIDQQQANFNAGWTPSGTPGTYQNEKGELYQALAQLGDASAALAGVTAHELTHATDPQNIHDSLSNSPNDVEEAPTKREIQILKSAVVKDVMNIVKSIIP